VLGEPAASFSQYQNELTPSCEQNEADSGYGRMTGSGYSLSNSRSQRERLGDEQISTSRPSPKSTVADKKDTAKHASFEENTKVLVFGTSDSSDDGPDKDKEKVRASSAKKREANSNNGPNSAKRKSAKQPDNDRKTNRNRSVSTDKVRKGRKDRSVSKERRGRSCSRRRKASPSRSASSAGSKNRSASIQKSKKQVQKDNKVVPASSSDDISSESDKDESNSQSIRVRSKHVLKPPKFHGKSSFETFWALFQNCADHSEWTRARVD